jgi:hypothetical protein
MAEVRGSSPLGSTYFFPLLSPSTRWWLGQSTQDTCVSKDDPSIGEHYEEDAADTRQSAALLFVPNHPSTPPFPCLVCNNTTLYSTTVWQALRS